MSDDWAPYTLPDRVPVERVRAGSTILVTGPADRQTRQFVLELACHGHSAGEGTLLVSPDRRTGELLADCRAVVDGFDPARTAVVDCTGRYRDDDAQHGCPVQAVSSPDDLTGVGIGIASLMDGFAEEGHDRIRTAILSLSTLLMYTEFRRLSRFVHTVTGRISTTGGLGVLALDPDTADDRTVSAISQLCDGRIHLDPEGSGDARIRVRGLGEPSPESRPATIDED